MFGRNTRLFYATRLPDAIAKGSDGETLGLGEDGVETLQDLTSYVTSIELKRRG